MRIQSSLVTELTPRNLISKILWFVVVFVYQATPSQAACPSGAPITAIFFANGITSPFTTDSISANDDLNDLELKLAPALAARGINAQCVKYSLAFNRTGITKIVGDLTETFSLGISDNLLKAWGWVAIPSSAPQSWTDAVFNEIYTLTNNLATQFDNTVSSGDIGAQLYDYSSIAPSVSKIITVAHSEGNFFANATYRSLIGNGIDRSKLAVIAVATPASEVAGDGPWTTLREDVVINYLAPILNLAPLAANVSNGSCSNIYLCHEFGPEYISGEISGPRIVDEIIGDIPFAPSDVVISNDKGTPDTLFAGAAQFTSPQNIGLQTITLYLYVVSGAENSDTQGVLLDGDNVNAQLYCATDVRSASAWGAASDTIGALATVGPFYGTQCNLVQGHHYSVLVHSTNPAGNAIGWGGYSSDGSVFYRAGLGAVAVEPLVNAKVVSSITNNRYLSIACSSIPDAAAGHGWTWALSDHPIDPYNYSTATYAIGTGPKPCTDNNYAFDLSAGNYQIPANSDVYLTTWSFGGFDFQIVDQHITYFGLAHWDGSVGTAK